MPFATQEEALFRSEYLAGKAKPVSDIKPSKDMELAVAENEALTAAMNFQSDMINNITALRDRIPALDSASPFNDDDPDDHVNYDDYDDPDDDLGGGYIPPRM